MSEEKVPHASLDRRTETVRCIQAEARSRRYWGQVAGPHRRRTMCLLGSHHRGESSASFRKAVSQFLPVSPVSGNRAIKLKNIVSTYNRVTFKVHLSTPSQSLPSRNESPHDEEVPGSPTMLNVSRSSCSRSEGFVRRMWKLSLSGDPREPHHSPIPRLPQPVAWIDRCHYP